MYVRRAGVDTRVDTPDLVGRARSDLWWSINRIPTSGGGVTRATSAGVANAFTPEGAVAGARETVIR